MSYCSDGDTYWINTDDKDVLACLHAQTEYYQTANQINQEILRGMKLMTDLEIKTMLMGNGFKIPVAK